MSEKVGRRSDGHRMDFKKVMFELNLAFKDDEFSSKRGRDFSHSGKQEEHMRYRI